jgi:RpiB/LacA/LacB family sugar-phosphate isomerase
MQKVSTIIMGSDHRGFELKERLKEYLFTNKQFFIDLGCKNTEPVDFPVVTKEVAECVAATKYSCGILICGTGIGVSIAANRYKGIRAALCHTVETAKLARQHNGANILCLAGSADLETAKKIVRVFLNTNFSDEEKYKRRNQMLDN